MSSTLAFSIPLNLSSASINELKGIGDMLQCMFVRNKNQHRRSHWWKALKGFRRELGLVLSELHTLHAASSSSKPALTCRLEARLRVLSEEKMHLWYMSFTQLVATGQFAPVGLVLMAAVARAAKLLGVTEVYEEIASADMRAVLDQFSTGAALGALGGLRAGEDEKADEGEVVERGRESDDEEVV